MAETTVKFKCPECQTSLEVGSKLIGKTGKCPNCDKVITVPDKDEQMPDKGSETVKKD